MEDDKYETNDRIGKDSFSTEQTDNTYFTINEALLGHTSMINPTDQNNDISMLMKPYEKPSNSLRFDQQSGSYVKEENTNNRKPQITNYSFSPADRNTNIPPQQRYDSPFVGALTGRTEMPLLQQKESSWKTVKSFPSETTVPKQCDYTYGKCPICRECATSTCNCALRDSRCSRGHTWHIKDGKVLLGNSHEMKNEDNSGGCIIM